MLQITPKLAIENIFGHYFGLLFLNHQLRAITNLGPHTLQKRKFYKFQAIIGIYFFAITTAWQIALDGKTSILCPLGVFWRQILTPKSLKMAILDTRLVWSVSKLIFYLWRSTSDT